MPITKSVKNVKENVRDNKTLKRIETVGASANVLKQFFEKGFKTFDALKSIVLHYYPDISEVRLYDFWYFRIVDNEICESLENVFDKLKSE
jgi:hypothetical protein